MRIVARIVATVLSTAALVTLAGASGGCGSVSEKPGLKWETVTSTQVSGERPVKLFLGVHPLGDRVRLAWVLSGPESPPVTLTLRMINVENGVGFGHTVAPDSEGHAIVRRDDQAIDLAVIPGDYRVFFTQRFPPARGPGYDIKLTMFTTRSAP